MNKNVLKYHQSIVAKANIAVLELASMLVMGKLPADTPEAIAGCRTALGKIYVPWVIPLIECSQTMKLTALADVDPTKMSRKERHVWGTVALENLIGQVGGFMGLNKMADHILPIMEALVDIMDDAGCDIKPESSAATPADTEESERAIVERIIREATHAADADGSDANTVTERVKAALLAKGIDADVKVVGIKPNGDVEGSLDDLPEDLQACVHEIQAALSEKHTVN
jgi:hypothetical protein